jgi:hypothetical protein
VIDGKDVGPAINRERHRCRALKPHRRTRARARDPSTKPERTTILPTIKPKRQRIFEAAQLKDAALIEKAEKALEGLDSPHAIARLIGSINSIHARRDARSAAFHGVGKDSDVDGSGYPKVNPLGLPFHPQGRLEFTCPRKPPPTSEEIRARLAKERADLVVAGDMKAVDAA